MLGKLFLRNKKEIAHAHFVHVPGSGYGRRFDAKFPIFITNSYASVVTEVKVIASDYYVGLIRPKGYEFHSIVLIVYVMTTSFAR